MPPAREEVAGEADARTRLGERSERDEEGLRRRALASARATQRLERLGVAVDAAARRHRLRSALASGPGVGQLLVEIARTRRRRGRASLRFAMRSSRSLQAASSFARSRPLSSAVSMPPSRSMLLEALPRLARQRVGERVEVVRAAGGIADLAERALLAEDEPGVARDAPTERARSRRAPRRRRWASRDRRRRGPRRRPASSPRSMFTQGSRCASVRAEQTACTSGRARRVAPAASSTLRQHDAERAQLAQLAERVPARRRSGA